MIVLSKDIGCCQDTVFVLGKHTSQILQHAHEVQEGEKSTTLVILFHEGLQHTLQEMLCGTKNSLFVVRYDGFAEVVNESSVFTVLLVRVVVLLFGRLTSTAAVRLAVIIMVIHGTKRRIASVVASVTMSITTESSRGGRGGVEEVRADEVVQEGAYHIAEFDGIDATLAITRKACQMITGHDRFNIRVSRYGTHTKTHKVHIQTELQKSLRSMSET